MVGGLLLAARPVGSVRIAGSFQCTSPRPLGPLCKETEDSIGGKCVPRCPPGAVRAVDGLACVPTK